MTNYEQARWQRELTVYESCCNDKMLWLARERMSIDDLMEFWRNYPISSAPRMGWLGAIRADANEAIRLVAGVGTDFLKRAGATVDPSSLKVYQEFTARSLTRNDVRRIRQDFWRYRDVCTLPEVVGARSLVDAWLVLKKNRDHDDAFRQLQWAAKGVAKRFVKASRRRRRSRSDEISTEFASRGLELFREACFKLYDEVETEPPRVGDYLHFVRPPEDVWPRKTRRLILESEIRVERPDPTSVRQLAKRIRERSGDC